MPGVVPDETNPFQAPQGVGVGRPLEPIPDAEIIRRSFLAHESKVRSLGLLGYLASALSFALGVLLLDEVLGKSPLTFRLIPARWEPFDGTALAAYLIVLAGIVLVLGLGLRCLAPWSRWATVTVAGVASMSYLARYALAFGLETSFLGRPGQVIGNSLGLLASGYVLLVLLSRRSGRVFGREYRAVVRQTPEIRPKVSAVAAVILGTVLGSIALGLIVLAVRWLVRP